MDKYLSKRWVPPLLIALATLLVWGRTTTFNFVWDDKLFIVNNPSIRSLKNIPEMFWSIATHSAPNPDPIGIFRPLRTIQYAVLYALGGSPSPQPWIFHLANLMWHAVAAMLLYSVAVLLFQKHGDDNGSFVRKLALLIALGFAVHPVTSEVVCWAKSLDDIMAAVFTLAATRALLKWTGDTRSYLAALGWFLLAVYSKESAVPFAVMTLFLVRFFHKQSWMRSLIAASSFVIIAAVYVIHRHCVIGQSVQCAPLSGTYGQTLLDMFPVATIYLRLLCGVPPFCFDYSYLQGHNAFFSGGVLTGLVILLLSVGATVWLWRIKSPAAIGLIWIGLFLLPVSNLLPMMQYMAERFLYLPLIGFLIVLGGLAAKISRPYVITLSWAGLILIWSAASLKRAPIWQDELTLFARSCLEGPRSARLEKNTMVAIFRLPHMQKLFRIDPQTYRLHMAETISRQDIGPIIQTLKQAHQLLPDNANIDSCLGLTLARIGQSRDAIVSLESAANLEPSLPQHWLNLGIISTECNENTKARDAFEKVLHLDPNHRDALRRLGQLSQRLGDHTAALQCFKKLLELEPGNPDVGQAVRESEEKLKSENRSRE